MSLNHPYRSFIHQVERPARYVGGEYRSVVKEVARVRMCLAFPDLYEIGMSHLGTKILYSLLNQEQEFAVERVYAPWFDMEQELRRRGLPLLSLETARPLAEFDVVGFSLQYELTYTNVLTILDLAGIPLRADQRNSSHPLVIAGGPSVCNPEPVAPFMDALVIGDGEEVLPRILHLVAEAKAAGTTREDLLKSLARLEGVYIPSLYRTRFEPRSQRLVVEQPVDPGVSTRVRRAVVRDINRYPFPADSPEPLVEAVFDRMAVEIARGCTEGCRFCQAGIIYRPARERDPMVIWSTMLQAVDQGGYDETSLTSLSTADYSCLASLVKRLMAELRHRHAALSVSSLRAYGLPEDLLDALSSVRETGLTFAPEAGTQRLRDVINKNIRDEEFLTTCHRVFSRGWRRIKLYYMIGLPTETDEDLAGILDMAHQALKIGRVYQRHVDVTVSVSSFVPKPHTPFQWCAMIGQEEIERKQRFLRNKARRMGLSLRFHDPRMSWLEGLFSRVDRRGADLVEMAWRLGARFDGWDDRLNWEAWQAAGDRWAHQEGLDLEALLAPLPIDARLPWDHVDVGVSPRFLAREYQRALEEELTPPCAKPLERIETSGEVPVERPTATPYVCHQCGLKCDLDALERQHREYEERLARSMEGTEGGGPGEQQAAYLRFRAGLTPRSFDRGANVRYRIRYHKLGRATLLGHLDLVRLIPRIFRRAGFPVCYSEGFHPLPELSFGPALALGISSLAEYLDVRLMASVDPEELTIRLTASAPDGIRFVAARQLADTERKLSRRLHAQDYLFAIPAEWFGEGQALSVILQNLEILCQEMMAREERIITAVRKGKEQLLDIRPSLVGCEVIPRDRWPPEVDLDHPAGVRIRIDLRRSGPTPQPREIAQAFFQREVPYPDIARIDIWTNAEDGSWQEP